MPVAEVMEVARRARENGSTRFCMGARWDSGGCVRRRRSRACARRPRRRSIAEPGSGARRPWASARLRNPLGRLTTPADVADVICLLCTDEARWVNGALLRVDGGEHVAGGP